MQNITKKHEQLKALLKCEELSIIIMFALSHWNLAKLVNKLNLNQKKVKTTKISSKELADILAKGAFSAPVIFEEICKTLNLYSAEAREAVKNSSFEEYRDSVFKEKGRIKKINIARLAWALIINPSKEKRLYGRKIIFELDENKRNVSLMHSDMEDGEKSEIKPSQHKDKKRYKNNSSKKSLKHIVSSKEKQELQKLKDDMESLKKENAKLILQIENDKDTELIREMDRKIKTLEKEKGKIREKFNKDFVSKEKFDALKKENERLYQLYSADKSYKKNEKYKGVSSVFGIFLYKVNRLFFRTHFLKKSKDCRVGIFIDVQNMFYSAKNLFHGRLDFEKFLNIALRGRKLIRATAYIVKTPEIDQSKFINLLKNNEYVVKTLDLKTGMNGFAKGNWDVGMVMDIFELADQLDVIVLASGDGDFVPLVKYLQKRGIRVEVYGFAYNTAIDLKECADIFYPIQEEIIIKDPRGAVKQH